MSIKRLIDKQILVYLYNGIPLKNIKKEMNYAFEPTPDLMHYDYNNYSIDDDYDLKDI